MNRLCKWGIHRPLKITEFAFKDVVSGEPVHYAKCPCGKKWMVNKEGWFGFKCEVKNDNS